MVAGCGLGSFGLGHEPVASSCEHGSWTFGFYKRRGI